MAVGGRPYIHKENQLDCSQGKRGSAFRHPWEIWKDPKRLKI